ncbi:VOC family protein [Streptomyces sp. NPDC048604]|uniref:VOC family protein n=1 Tax=Streptomyces sp. NPDC048604 TaxID=3365578 RepID=UPI003714735F
MAPPMTLSAITLDCADPMALMAFYRDATGLPPHPESDDEFAGLGGFGKLFLGFQRVDGYRPPTWPDQLVPQQLHICWEADDLDAAETRLLELGAGRPDHQPEPDRWRVLTDPAGHPFCLVPRP